MGRIKYTKDLENKVKKLERDNRDLRKLNKDNKNKRDEYWDTILSLREIIMGLRRDLGASAIKNEEWKHKNYLHKKYIKLLGNFLKKKDKMIKLLRGVNSDFFKNFDDLKYAYLHFRDENFKLKDDLLELNKKNNKLEEEIDKLGGTPYASSNSNI